MMSNSNFRCQFDNISGNFHPRKIQVCEIRIEAAQSIKVLVTRWFYPAFQPRQAAHRRVQIWKLFQQASKRFARPARKGF